jgi:hypothetical protein
MKDRVDSGDTRVGFLATGAMLVLQNQSRNMFKILVLQPFPRNLPIAARRLLSRFSTAPH